jgi:hypothetical protein
VSCQATYMPSFEDVTPTLRRWSTLLDHTPIDRSELRSLTRMFGPNVTPPSVEDVA